MPLNQLGRDWVGKSSGFPENFEPDIRSIYRQMMRCYAHLYHGHWLRPFWDVNAYKELNTCFIHFVNVGKQFELLGDKEMEPMQPLIDLWLQKGYLPATQQQPAPQQQAPQRQPSPMQMQQQHNPMQMQQGQPVSSGFVQPGLGQQGLGQPGLGQQGLGQPGLSG
jgi:hypothetical protein